MKTKVIFRRYRDGAVIALFPELPGTTDVNTCLSYMHDGQHASATIHVVGITTLCGSGESSPLREELERIGYDLEVIERFQSKHRVTRRIAIEAIEG